MAKKPIIRYFDRGVWYDATVSDIGNLEDLNTVHKTTVVEAINDIVGGNFTISGNLLDRLNGLDESIAGLDQMITSGTLNENQAEKINQFVIEKLNELNQSMEELNKQRDQRLKEQEQKVAQLKLDSESDKQRIEEVTEDLNATKEKLNNAELNVTSITQLVDEINGKISQAVSKTDFDTLEGTVREQKTLIDQTAEGIKLLATKEELDQYNEDVKSVKSEFELKAGLIESKVSSEQLINEIEKIDKYMPNLLRYTRNWQDWENDDEANIDVTLNEYRDCIIQRVRGIGKGLSTTVEDLEIGETYSLSVWVKHDDKNAKVYAMVDNEGIIMTDLNSEETFVGNEFKRMRCSFVAQDTTAKVRFIFKDCRTDSYGYLAGAKCEKNKKVSGWQPHSEDVYQSIKSARSEIKQTDEKITTLVETVTEQGELIKSHKTSIEETDKAITLQAESIKTLGESIETTQADLKVTSEAITSKVWKADVGEMISDINIDNKNRVLNSDFGDGWKLWSETNNLFQLKKIGNYKFAVAERSGLPQNMAIAIATNKFPVKHNERLMFGFYFYCADLSKLDNKIVGALELLDINDIRIDRVDFDVSELSLENGSFTKLTDTYFIEDERIVKARLRFFLNRNGNVGFALPMVQGGDIKSSDWSLAPEDVARRFNDTNVTITNYEQTVNGFKQTVESYKGSVDGYSSQVSEFNQTVNGFSQTVKEYKESNDKRVQQLESSLTTEAGKIEAVVKESAGTKDALGELTADGGRISQLELTAQGFSTTVGDITKSVTRTNERIDNINIGGRNLFVDAGFKKEVRITNDYDTGYWYSYVGTKFNYPKFDDDCNYLYFTANNNDSFGVMQFFDTNKLIKGQTYSVRTQVKTDANTTFRYQLIKKNQNSSYDWYFNYSDTTVTTIGEWVDVKWTFTIPKDDDAMRYGVAIRNLQTGTETALRIIKPKLETGNIHTGFSIAPEDTQSQIDNINNNLREQYMTIEQSNSWIDQKKDSIVQGVSSSVETLGTRLDNISTGNGNYLFGKYISKSHSDNVFSFNDNTGEGAVRITGATGSWGKGIKFNRNDIPIYSGETMFIGLTVKVDKDCTYAFDVNNARVDRQGTGNDFDIVKQRIGENGSLKAGIWKRVYVMYTAGDIPITNYGTLFGVYTSNSSDTINLEFKEVTMTKSNIPVAYTKPIEYTENRLDNLQVGGRNILRGTKDMKLGSGKWTDGTWRQSNTGTTKNVTLTDFPLANITQGIEITSDNSECGIAQDNLKLESGEYTLSYYVKAKTANTTVRLQTFWNAENGGTYKDVVLKDTNWTRVSMTRSLKTNQNSISAGYIFVETPNRTITVACAFEHRSEVVGEWSLAPEDQQSQIDGINDNLTKNYYTKTDVDAQISTSKDGIVLDYKKEVQSIGMGGANLARNTTKSWAMGFGIPNTRYDSNGRTTLVYNSSTNVSQNSEILPQGDGFYITPINGNTYTQSLYIETNATYNEKETFNFTWFTAEGGHNYQKGHIVKLGNNTYRIWSTFKWNRTNSRLRLFDISDLYKVLRYRTSGTYISFFNPKVEIGYSPTAWSPSPEDIQSQIDGVNNNLRDNYYNKTTVDSMLKVDGQGITTYVKSTKSQLDSLSVGGRNLLFQTGYFGDKQLSSVVGESSKINLSKTIITDTTSPSGKAYRVNKYKKGTENVNGGCYWRMPKKLVAGKKYTWSVYVRGFGTVDAFGPEQGGGKAVKLTNTWTKVSHTFTANSNQYYQFTFYSNTEFDLYFTDLMLEEGNTPSPWQPAPEDYNDKIDGVSGNLDDLDKKIGNIDTWKTEVAESFIKQTADSLSTLIKDKNGSSLMRFDSTSATWSFNTDVLEKNISNAKDAGDEAQKTANEANELAKGLKNLLDDIQNKTAYITMTTYNGQPCIELGKTDNNFKVRITNTSVDFLDGSTRVAYVSNNQLYIDKAVVKNEFQIGEGTGFVWKKRSNGNMGLRWGG